MLWKDESSCIHISLLRATVKANSMPTGQTYLILKQLTDVYIQCMCTLGIYFCAKCFGSNISIFQVGEVSNLSSMHACFINYHFQDGMY